MVEKGDSIKELLEGLRKRWVLIISITLATTLISVIVSFFIIKPQYEASMKMFVGKQQEFMQRYNSADIQMYQKLLKTYAETIKTQDLVIRATSGLNIEMTQEKILSGLTVIPVIDTQIFELKLKGNNPEEVAKVLTVLGAEGIETFKELTPNVEIETIEGVRTPKVPISPNKKRNVIIAFLLGIMGSIGICFLLDMLDNTFKNKNQVERELNLPVIGVISKSKNK